MMNFDEIKNTFTRAQGFSTGVAALVSVIKYHKAEIPDWLLTVWTNTKEGITSMKGLNTAAQLCGFDTQLTQQNIIQLKDIREPAILFMEREDGVKDYVVCYGFDGHRFIIGDTSWGLMQYWPEELEYLWVKGITLCLEPNDNFLTTQKTKFAIESSLNRYLKKDFIYWIITSIGALLSIIYLYVGVDVISKSPPFIRVLYALIGVFIFYFFSVAHIKWKSKAELRMDAFWTKILTNSLFEVGDIMKKLEIIYVWDSILFIYTFLYYMGLFVYSFRLGVLSVLFTSLYIPLSSFLIGLYGIWIKNKYNNKEVFPKHLIPKEPLIFIRKRELEELISLRIVSLCILNTFVIVWFYYPNIIFALPAFLISIGFTYLFYDANTFKKNSRIAYWILKEYKNRVNK